MYRTQLSMLLEGCNYLAEIRRAQEPTSFFDELTGSEQKEWVNDLLSRTEFHPSSASVCILDTGIMYSHPLLQPAIDENNVQAVNDQWGKTVSYTHLDVYKRQFRSGKENQNLLFHVRHEDTSCSFAEKGI